MVRHLDKSGDFRTPSGVSTDPALTHCRAFNNSSHVYFGTTQEANCRLTAGDQYYLNIVFANPFGGLDTTEDTCSLASYQGRCEANFTD